MNWLWIVPASLGVASVGIVWLAVEDSYVRRFLSTCGGASYDTLRQRAKYTGRKARSAEKRLRDARWLVRRARRSRKPAGWHWSRDEQSDSHPCVLNALTVCRAAA